MNTGIHGVLNQVAEAHRARNAKSAEAKTAFIPMAGDPAAAGGGAPPADPMAAGGGAPPTDPMAAGVDPAMMAAAGGALPPEIMAMQGAQIDPAMAMAGGALPPGMDPAATAPPPADAGGVVPPEIQAAIDAAVAAATGGGGGEGGGGKGAAKADQLGNIESMLNQVVGVLVGRGELPQDALTVAPGTESEAPAETAPAAQAAEFAPTPMGGPVEAGAVPKLAADEQPVKAAADTTDIGHAKSAAQSIVEIMGRLAERRK